MASSCRTVADSAPRAAQSRPSLRRRYRAAALAAAGMLLLATGCSRDAGGPKNSASPLRMRLMSAQQYAATLSFVFGADVGDSAPSPLPPLTRTGGLLELGSAAIGVTSDQLQQLAQTAATVAAKVVDEKHRDYLIPCKPAATKGPDPRCARSFVQVTGRLLYRRRLRDEEIDHWVTLAGTAATQLKDFYAGLAGVIEGMLISPDVIFIVERAEPDPERPGQQRLDAYSLASRLSFFLWNTVPDDELLRSAESGEIQTVKGRARAVERMLASSRLEDGVRAFFDDLWEFDKFNSLAKDSLVYPAITGATLADAREQTLRTVVDHLLTRDQDYRDLFTTRRTFISMNLAAVYGVPAVEGWTPYEFAEGLHRGGMLTQVSFLAAHAHPARSSATLRGKALRELLLCQKVPAPPPNVDFSLLEDPDSSLHTARERLQVHAKNPSCAGCHLIMDPMGLALEKFDGAGQFRDTERGAAIDPSGNLDGASFTDVDGLNRALHDHPMLPSCLVKRLYSYGTGGPVSMGTDRDVIAHLNQRFAHAGYKVPDLLHDIALSHAFSQVRRPRASAVGPSQAPLPQVAALNLP
jgi:uncharacterized protein DUF1592/uncharacterized protein DUF1588/uncharacterized protein DUF1595/uncharacterized protein DUF1585